MINELLWVVLLAVSFGSILGAYKLFGRIGLYMWVIISIILANIQVLKIIPFFGLVTALGNIIYGTIFLATDIMNENHGKKEAANVVAVGFCTLIIVTVIMQITLYFVPHESDVLSPALAEIFGFLPRIAIASLLAYVLSQLHDVWAFDFWKRKFKGKYLWLRNNMSTFVSQTIDNVVFTWIAFVGFNGVLGFERVLPWEVIGLIFVTSILMKYVVLVLDTPFIYIARKMKGKYILTKER